MKIRKIAAVLLAAVVLCLLASCAPQEPETEQTGQIFLYGEPHAVEIVYEKEFELWSAYYHDRGMRHLFIESPYFEAEFFNLWMRSDDDEILDAIYWDIDGTLADNPGDIAFFKRIKQECPETVFHGTDVGHQCETMGKRFLEYLESTGQADTEQYRLAQENIEQGLRYFEDGDTSYRENMLVQNFIREMERLDNADVMVIYGWGHAELDAMDYWGSKSVPTMATQLREVYGDDLHVQEVGALVEPYRTDAITMGEKEYAAQYFGKAYWPPNHPDCLYAEYWRLEDAYDDAKSMPLIFQYLGYSWYPVKVEDGQVFVVDYTYEDGSVLREFYRSSGLVLKHYLVTEGFDPQR